MKRTLAVAGVLFLFLAAPGAHAFGKKRDPQPSVSASPSAAPTVSLGTAPSVPEGKVWVQKNDGTISCEDPKGAESVEAGKKKLEQAGVRVEQGMKQSDGLMRATVCGMPQGMFNRYLIDRKDLAKAQALGYQPF